MPSTVMYKNDVRADRLLSILMRIQLRGHATAGELSRDLEVSVRTIHRDIESLCQAGVPMVIDRGRYGGFSLIKGYRTQLTGMSAPEAHALPFVGLDAAAALGLEESAEAAWLKVLAALPPKTGEGTRSIRDRFHLDPVDWYQRVPAPTHLRPIAAATWSSNRVRIDYESWRSRKERTVDPLGLVLKAGRWYLLASSPQSTRVAIYRLEDVRGVEILGEQFRPPKDYHLSQTWRAEVLRFEASLKRSKATLRVAPSALSRVDRLGGENAETIRNTVPGLDGWRLTEIWIEDISHAASLLLGFGTDIEVVEPDALRREISTRAVRVRDLYRKQSTRRHRARNSKQSVTPCRS
jgi:predicted DNA-binding transcriptional regulator YafY